jgi:hypothetical protein
MDDFTLALIIIGDMTLTERKLRAEVEDLRRSLDLPPAGTDLLPAGTEKEDPDADL